MLLISFLKNYTQAGFDVSFEQDVLHAYKEPFDTKICVALAIKNTAFKPASFK